MRSTRVRAAVLLLAAGCFEQHNVGTNIDAGSDGGMSTSCGGFAEPCCSNDSNGCTAGLFCVQGICVPPGPPRCDFTCSAPNTSTVCVSGTVRDFVSPNAGVAEPTSISKLRVRVYDPIALLVNPSTPPLDVVDIQNAGCYAADGVRRPSSGLIGVTIDDADPLAADDFATFGFLGIIQANQNLTGFDVYWLAKTTVAAWDSQVGPMSGCSGGLLGCGATMLQFLDSMGSPVTGVLATRPGDDPSSADVFCFRGDRMHLSTADLTDATGLCLISPDAVGSHGGACSPSGCRCGSQACNPSWTPFTAGSSAGILFFQSFRAPQ